MNLFYSTFELVFSVSVVFLTYRIVTTKNVVESVLFLIVLAINISLFLLLIGTNFLAALYLAVYIGAVAVFFLFVVMMTDLTSLFSRNNINEEESGVLNSFLLPVGVKHKFIYLVFVLFLGLSISNLLIKIFTFSNFVTPSSNVVTPLASFLDSFNLNVEAIGFTVFNEHSAAFLLISFVILIALIGSIFITTTVNSSSNLILIAAPPALFNTSFSENEDYRSQCMENQHIRSFINSIYLK